MPFSEEVQALRAQGYRITPQRLQILQVMISCSDYPTAEDIHAAIVPQQPSLDIATVYRTLQWLQSVGLVAPIEVGDGRLRYEYHPHGNAHHHLVCQECGTSIQIPPEAVMALRDEVRQRYNFTLEDHLVLPGRCGGCQDQDDALAE